MIKLKTFLTPLRLTLLFLFLAFDAIFIFPIISNELYLLEVESKFNKIIHPSYSVKVKREKKLGLLEGNSNHCDFFVAELRGYPNKISINDIENYYKKLDTKVIRSEIDGSVLGIVHLKNKSYLEGGSTFLKDVNYEKNLRLLECKDNNHIICNYDWQKMANEDSNNYYIVYILKYESANNDLRCH